uniref:Uncharacterized protein n=1 Tax=Suricata suricatta TaxID=37032 RepID=A0A673TKQ3_SURSU
MAVTFQMLAVQQSTSHAIHNWHSRRPSCQRRPDSSCTRLRGMTRAATSTSEMAMDATRLCGTRWKVRTRRMVASTSRFQEKVAATRKPSKAGLPLMCSRCRLNIQALRPHARRKERLRKKRP